MQIVIYGNGAFGKALIEACERSFGAGTSLTGYGRFDPSSEYGVAWIQKEAEPIDYTRMVAIYAGKGHGFTEMLEFCQLKRVRLIQASTDTKLTGASATPTMNAPNLNPLIVAALKGLEQFWRSLQPIRPNLAINVSESHQRTKPNVSGTARTIAEIAGFPQCDITMIREAAVQRLIGVRNLDRHGYHFLDVRAFGAEIGFHTKADGLEPYADGAINYFAPRFSARAGLENRIYSVTDFI